MAKDPDAETEGQTNEEEGEEREEDDTELTEENGHGRP